MFGGNIVPDYSQTRPKEGWTLPDLRLAAFPRERLQAGLSISPSLLGTDYAGVCDCTFMGGVAIVPPEGQHTPPAINRNAVHCSFGKINRDYRHAIENLLGIEGGHAALGYNAWGGSTAVTVAARIVNRYQEMLQAQNPQAAPLRRGLLCTEKTHLSGIEADPDGLLHVTLEHLTEQKSCRTMAAMIERGESGRRPAALLLTPYATAGTAGDSVCMEIVELCGRLRVPIIVDLSASTIALLSTDFPLYEGDPAPAQKALCLSLLARPEVKMAVTAFHKFCGDYGEGALHVLHADDGDPLCAAARDVLHLSHKARYFRSSGHALGTSRSPEAMLKVLEMLEHWGPWGLRFLAVNAVQTARELERILDRDYGLPVLRGFTNCVVVKLSSESEVERVQSAMEREHRIDVAATHTPCCGVRVVVKAGLEYHEFAKRALVRAIAAAVKDVPIKALPEPAIKLPGTFCLPRCFAVPPKALTALRGYYEDGNKNADPLPAPSIEEQVLAALQLVQYHSGIDTGNLGAALKWAALGRWRKASFEIGFFQDWLRANRFTPAAQPLLPVLYEVAADLTALTRPLIRRAERERRIAGICQRIVSAASDHTARKDLQAMPVFSVRPGQG